MKDQLFDEWTEKYDSWFETDVGRLVKKYESELLLELLSPRPEEFILDAGCGTGVFTRDVINKGAQVVGMDLSVPMVSRGAQHLNGEPFQGLCGDMCALPFQDNCFDSTFSMTAIEFIADAAKAIHELNRVTKPGGQIVVTTLNSLSPWAVRREKKAKEGHSLFQNIFFRSPEDMRRLLPEDRVIRTAIHFGKDDPVAIIPELERAGKDQELQTGAFLAAGWRKG